MARIRYLKPDFFKDEDVAELPYATRLFYAGLWTQADKEGRIEDRTKRLKVEIMPYDDVDIDKMLEELSKPKKNSNHPFILRYEIKGEKYIQILQWSKHQKPHHTEKESKIPPYNTKGMGKGKGKGKGDNILNSILKEKGMENQLNSSTELTNGSLTVKEQLLRFDEIWIKYPNKDGKKDALRHFEASVKTEQDWIDINIALQNYLMSERVLKGYIKNGSTWFNNWRDWVDYKEKPKIKLTDKEMRDKIDEQKFIQKHRGEIENEL